MPYIELLRCMCIIGQTRELYSLLPLYLDVVILLLSFVEEILRMPFNFDTNMVFMFDRTSEILKQLKVLFGSVTTIPAQVFLTGYLIS